MSDFTAELKFSPLLIRTNALVFPPFLQNSQRVHFQLFLRSWKNLISNSVSNRSLKLLLGILKMVLKFLNLFSQEAECCDIENSLRIDFFKEECAGRRSFFSQRTVKLVSQRLPTVMHLMKYVHF